MLQENRALLQLDYFTVCGILLEKGAFKMYRTEDTQRTLGTVLVEEMTF